MLGRTDRRLRHLALLAVFVLVAGSLATRLAFWQVVRAGDLAAMARSQLQGTRTEPSMRGAIYDRSGTVLLATTAYFDDLVAYPAQLSVEAGRRLVAPLAAILGLGEAARQRLQATLAGDAAYAVLARRLTAAQSAAIRTGLADGSLSQLALEPQAVRVYPDPGGAPDMTLASQLLGFVNGAGQGQYGIEQRYQAALAGRPRVVTGLQDIAGRPFVDSEQVVDPGEPGSDLRLTIDAGLQLDLERELYAAWVADRAASATAVILDPDTGAVLAWASVPGYDANAYAEVATANAGRFVDPVISTVYEPGSVMKMFVAAAGFASGAITETTPFLDSGVLTIGGYKVFDADQRARGTLPFQDGIAYSRNIVAALAAQRLGATTAAASAVLYRTWQALGLGAPTGADVAGEVGGIAADPAQHPWAAIDLANRSFGQGVAVTQLQLASAFSAMINGGIRIQPHVVAAVGGAALAAAAPVSVLPAGVSDRLRALLVHVVSSVPYYAAGTLIPGWTVGGKTGTAQIWDAKAGEWMPNTYDDSFVGFVGEGPRAVISLRLDHVQPHVLRQGVVEVPITSYQLFRRVALDAIDALALPGDRNPAQAPGSVTALPPGAANLIPDPGTGPTPAPRP